MKKKNTHVINFYNFRKFLKKIVSVPVIKFGEFSPFYKFILINTKHFANLFNIRAKILVYQINILLLL